VCKTFEVDPLDEWTLVRNTNFIRASELKLNHLECFETNINEHDEIFYCTVVW